MFFFAGDLVQEATQEEKAAYNSLRPEMPVGVDPDITGLYPLPLLGSRSKKKTNRRHSSEQHKKIQTIARVYEDVTGSTSPIKRRSKSPPKSQVIAESPKYEMNNSEFLQFEAESRMRPLSAAQVAEIAEPKNPLEPKSRASTAHSNPYRTLSGVPLPPYSLTDGDSFFRPNSSRVLASFTHSTKEQSLSTRLGPCSRVGTSHSLRPVSSRLESFSRPISTRIGTSRSKLSINSTDVRDFDENKEVGVVDYEQNVSLKRTMHASPAATLLAEALSEQKLLQERLYGTSQSNAHTLEQQQNNERDDNQKRDDGLKNISTDKQNNKLIQSRSRERSRERSRRRRSRSRSRTRPKTSRAEQQIIEEARKALLTEAKRAEKGRIMVAEARARFESGEIMGMQMTGEQTSIMKVYKSASKRKRSKNKKLNKSSKQISRKSKNVKKTKIVNKNRNRKWKPKIDQTKSFYQKGFSVDDIETARHDAKNADAFIHDLTIEMSKDVPTYILLQHQQYSILWERGIILIDTMLDRYQWRIMRWVWKIWVHHTTYERENASRSHQDQFKMWWAAQHLFIRFRKRYFRFLKWGFGVWKRIYQDWVEKRQNEAAVVIVRAMRAFYEVRFAMRIKAMMIFQQKKNAAALIQKNFRYYIIWKHLRRNNAAIDLQRLERGRQGRVIAREAKRHHCARWVQRVWRGRIGRIAYEKYKLAWLIEMARKNKAARAIQRRVRGMVTRRLYRDLCDRRALASLESAMKAVSDAERLVAQYKIGSAYAHYKEHWMRKAAMQAMLKAMLEAQKLVAVITLQRFSRRKDLRLRIEETVRRLQNVFIQAAILIQTHFRGMLARHEYIRLSAQRAAAIRIQAVVRGILTREWWRYKLIHEGPATLKIQRFWRHHRQRRRMRKMLWKWRRHRRRILRPVLREWCAVVQALISWRRQRLREAMRMWRMRQLYGKWRVWCEYIHRIKLIRKALAFWMHMKKNRVYRQWLARMHWQQERRQWRGRRARELIYPVAGHRLGSEMWPLRTYDSNGLRTDRDPPKPRLQFVKWQVAAWHDDYLSIIFHEVRLKRQVWSSLKLNARVWRIQNTVANMQLRRRHLFLLGFRLHRWRQFVWQQHRKYKAYAAGLRMMRLRIIWRWKTFVRIMQLERDKLRRALLLWHGKLKFQTFVRWQQYRLTRKRVKSRAYKFCSTKYTIAWRAWLEAIRIWQTAEFAISSAQLKKWKQRRGIRILQRNLFEAGRWRAIEKYANVRSQEAMKFAMFQKWQKMLFDLRLERLKTPMATRVQAAFRRKKGIQMFAEMKQKVHFNYVSEILSGAKILEATTPRGLGALAAQHEFLVIMFWMLQEPGAKLEDSETQAFSKSAQDMCTKGSMRVWKEGCRYVRINGTITKVARCWECRATGVPFRRQQGAPDHFLCRSCWDKQKWEPGDELLVSNKFDAVDPINEPPQTIGQAMGISSYPGVCIFWRGRRAPDVGPWSRVCKPFKGAWNAKELTSWVKEAMAQAKVEPSKCASELQRKYRGIRGRRFFLKAILEHRRKLRAEGLIEKNNDSGVEKDQWRECWDQTEQSYYWYNTVTQESSWKNPHEEYREPEKLPEQKETVDLTQTDTTLNPAEYPDALLCSNCSDHTTNCVIAGWHCIDCAIPFCSNCLAERHRTGNRAGHFSTRIQIDAMTSGALLCSNCETSRAIRNCEDCDVNLCVDCYVRSHRKGNRLYHNWHEIDASTQSEECMQHQKRAALGGLYESRKSLSKKQLIQAYSDYANKLAKSKGWLTWRMLHNREEKKKKHEDNVEEYKEKLKDIFDFYDKDDSGFIDQRELIFMLRKELCEPITTEQAKEAMKEMDTDGNGEIGFDEFVEWFVTTSVENNNKSILTRAFKRKLLLDKGLRVASDAVRKSAALRSFARIKTGVRVINSEYEIDIAGRIASVVGDGLFNVKCDSGEMMEGVEWRYLHPRPLVSGTQAFRLRIVDYSNRKDALVRYAKERHDIDIDMYATNQEKMKEAFQKFLMPAWNAGKLDPSYYKDDYEFESRGNWWTQNWDNDKKQFIFTNQKTGKKQMENPYRMDVLRSKLAKSFSKYVDIIVPSDYLVEIRNTDELKLESLEDNPDDLSDDELDFQKSMCTSVTYEIPLLKKMVKQRATGLREIEAYIAAFVAKREKEESKKRVKHKGHPWPKPPPGQGGVSRKNLTHLLNKELCEPYMERQVDLAFEQIDYDGNGEISFEEFLLWFVREEEKPYRNTLTIKKRKMKLKAAKAKRIASHVAGKMTPGEEIRLRTKEKIANTKKKLNRLGLSSECSQLMDMGYTKEQSKKSLMISRNKIELAIEYLRENFPEPIKPGEGPKKPGAMGKLLAVMEDRRTEKKLKEMERKRELVREIMNRKRDRLAGMFGDGSGATEVEEKQSVVYGCCLCICDEFLADPKRNGKCAACGHEERDHTIEFELYYSDDEAT